jgi:transcription factor IIIB subunit 2
MHCPSCGSQEIETNDAGGDAVCVNCSTVVEENAIVSSIEFSEAGGSSSVIGQYVSPTCTKPYGSGGAGR